MRSSLSTLTWECLRLLCQPLIRLLRNWTAPDNKSLTSSVAADMTRSRLDLIWENAFLRQQMIILSRQPKRPALTCDRVILVLLVTRLPIGAPKANAICERFLGSLRRECLDYFLILSERHLHRIVKEYVAYFNHARPHQGIKQRIPCQPEPQSKTGRIVSYPVLGGLHHDYRRKAA